MAAKTHPKDAEGWDKVISTLRGQGHRFPHAYLASQIGIKRQGVRLWKAVPIEHLATVSKLCGIPREKILPHTTKRILG